MCTEAEHCSDAPGWEEWSEQVLGQEGTMGSVRDGEKKVPCGPDRVD